MKQPLRLKSKNIDFLDILRVLLIVFIGVVISNVLIIYVIQGANINGDSMYPTYKNNQYVLVDKISWKLSNRHNIQRDDVIVCKSDYNKGELLIKRVIALPGEKIRIDTSGVIYINDEKIDDTYGYYHNNLNILSINIEKTMGDNEYFVCGDNRNSSLDSRFDAIGNIQRKNIIGRVMQLQSNIDLETAKERLEGQLEEE